jgi:hypothetical protein
MFEGTRKDRRDEGSSIRPLAVRHEVHRRTVRHEVHRRTVRQALANATPPERARSRSGTHQCSGGMRRRSVPGSRTT